MDPEDMPKLNLSKDAPKLSTSDLFHIKKAQDYNLDRVARLKVVRRKNLITASLLGTAVVAIYGWTIYSVKQEKFLDDFEIPQTTTQKH